jgi:phosphoenolpyruvate carboxylase
MRDAGITQEQALEWLAQIEVILVFTAHPTEVARRTVLFKRQRIAAELEQLDRLPLTERDAQTHEEAIISEITALWQTDEVRRRRPAVRDEIRMGLDYYPSVLFETLPACTTSWPTTSVKPMARVTRECLPRVLRFGSWIGGDRDGNPLVTPECTRDALADRSRNDSRLLLRARERSDLATQSLDLPGSSLDGTRSALNSYATTVSAPDLNPERHPPQEVYRRFLDYVLARLLLARDEPCNSECIQERR